MNKNEQKNEQKMKVYSCVIFFSFFKIQKNVVQPLIYNPVKAIVLFVQEQVT